MLCLSCVCVCKYTVSCLSSFIDLNRFARLEVLLTDVI